MSEGQALRFYGQYDYVALASIRATPGRTYLSNDTALPNRTASVARHLPTRFAYMDDDALERGIYASASLASLLSERIEADAFEDDRYTTPTQWTFRACHWSTMRDPINNAEEIRSVHMMCYTPHEEMCVALYNVAALSSQYAVRILSRHGGQKRRPAETHDDVQYDPLSAAKGMLVLSQYALRAVYLESTLRPASEAETGYAIKGTASDISGTPALRMEDCPPHVHAALLQASIYMLGAQADRLSVEIAGEGDGDGVDVDDLLHNAHSKYEAAHALHADLKGRCTLDVIPGRDARLAAVLRHLYRSERLLAIEQRTRNLAHAASTRHVAVQYMNLARKSLLKHRSFLESNDDMKNNPLKSATPTLLDALELDDTEYEGVEQDVSMRQRVIDETSFSPDEDVPYLREQAMLDQDIVDERTDLLACGTSRRITNLACRALGYSEDEMIEDMRGLDHEAGVAEFDHACMPARSADILRLLLRMSVTARLVEGLGNNVQRHKGCPGDASDALHSAVVRALDDMSDAMAIAEHFLVRGTQTSIVSLVRTIATAETSYTQSDSCASDTDASRTQQRIVHAAGLPPDTIDGSAPHYIVHNLSLVVDAIFERLRDQASQFTCRCTGPGIANREETTPLNQYSE